MLPRKKDTLEILTVYELQHVITNNVVCATSKGSDQPVHMRSLIRIFAGRLNVLMTLRLLTKHHLEFLSLKGGSEARMSLHLSKCHIVGNHMSWLIYIRNSTIWKRDSSEIERTYRENVHRLKTSA